MGSDLSGLLYLWRRKIVWLSKSHLTRILSKLSSYRYRELVKRSPLLVFIKLLRKSLRLDQS